MTDIKFVCRKKIINFLFIYLINSQVNIRIVKTSVYEKDTMSLPNPEECNKM